MSRDELEQALQASAEATGETDFILFGSQSVHAHTDEPPVEVLISMECDVWPRRNPTTSTVLREKLGQNTLFHTERGYFVDAVDAGIILLPEGWELRLRPLQAGKATAWCLEVNDLVVSKLNAGRLKDYEFINAVLRAHLADFEIVVQRIESFPDLHQRAVLLARLRISGERMP